MAYLAVTDTELALVNVKSGRWTMKLDELIVRIPRTDVASAELGSGVICPLTITFADGEIWRLEVSRINKKQAQAVVHTVGASADQRAESARAADRERGRLRVWRGDLGLLVAAKRRRQERT
jgi:hypothetical protein